eukprot:scaffold10856_cov229-Amphora_coffeaeformis.AAC.7
MQDVRIPDGSEGNMSLRCRLIVGHGESGMETGEVESQAWKLAGKVGCSMERKEAQSYRRIGKITAIYTTKIVTKEGLNDDMVASELRIMNGCRQRGQQMSANFDWAKAFGQKTCFPYDLSGALALRARLQLIPNQLINQADKSVTSLHCTTIVAVAISHPYQRSR